MYKTKGFVTGAVLLSLVLIFSSIGLACGAKPVQEPASPPVTEPANEPETTPSTPPPATDETPPAPTETVITDNYTTYTDEAQFFSISYPSDWVTTFSLIPGLEQNSKDAVNKLKSGVPLEQSTMIFLGGRRTETALEPNMNISVEPVTSGTATYAEIIEVEVQGVRNAFLDFQELSRVETTVDGREATILDWEGTLKEQKLHFLQMITVIDNTVWIVTCISLATDFTEWQNDFNTIVRSLRISD
jgi:hypothetical protein